MAITLRPHNQISKFIRKAITTKDYKSFLQDFLRNRSETVKYEDEGITIHIYSPELAYILTLNTEIQTDIYNKTNKEVIITTEYLGYFFDGFIAGLKKFQDEYKLSTDTIYSGNISDYIEDIKHHCFNKKIKLREYGWSFVRLQYPLTFKKDLIREYGFYSGLVRSVDELIENSPERFKELYLAKRNFENKFLTSDGIRPLATVASAFRTLNTPTFLNCNKENYKLVMDIRRLINDDGKITSILNFKKKTKDVFDRIEFEQRKELFEFFKDSTINDLALKKGQKEAGTATYISNKKKKIGRTSIQSELKKTPVQNLIAKIETLEAYLNWLNEYYEELQALPPQQTEKPKPVLTINQIALKYVYSEIQITRKNGNEIAKEYGHNSGEKLFQRFTFYSSPANRKGRPQPCTPKKLKNKIELLESVLEHLPKDKQNRIKDEVSILKTIQETEYL